MSTETEVVIHLLDPSSGRPVKSWTFQNQDRITIGRSDDQDISMSDPYISRAHAELVVRDGIWYLTSLGRNGVLVANDLVQDFMVGIELYFRLGTKGPLFLFSAHNDRNSPSATIIAEEEVEPMFNLDLDRIEEEVTQIAEGEYFQKLQEKVRRMRVSRPEPRKDGN
jgi:pSer/pThr/pTyr-binding forkhead associated (FHA) protein